VARQALAHGAAIVGCGSAVAVVAIDEDGGLGVVVGSSVVPEDAQATAIEAIPEKSPSVWRSSTASLGQVAPRPG
jgi:hypothetical protein